MLKDRLESVRETEKTMMRFSNSFVCWCVHSMDYYWEYNYIELVFWFI